MKNDCITPQSRKCFGQKIIESEQVISPENILSSKPCTLENRGAGQAYMLLDMGEYSVGGYPVFTVKSFHGSAKLRIAYSDRLCAIDRTQSGRIYGDFVRGCCKYLGVELPVLPANPGRYEVYTIARTGEYVFPLIQGQERFVLLMLEGENASVELESFYIWYTSFSQPCVNEFDCDDLNLKKLWYVSANTLCLATLQSRQWDILNGKLLLRALTKCNPAGLVRGVKSKQEFTFSFDFSIAYNPDMPSGIGAYFAAKDKDNGFVLNLDLDGALSLYRREGGVNRLLERTFVNPLTDGVFYSAKVCGTHDAVSLYLNGECIYTAQGDFAEGCFGFCQTMEKWAIVSKIRIEEQGSVLFEDDFSEEDLRRYDIVTEDYFIADGAKRDRLPWSGDTDWSFRSGFYCYSFDTAMKNTLEIFARHQNPEGYVFGTCYPENHIRPGIGEYGMYESDMFSAWYLLSACTYYEYTGDEKLIRKLYPSLLAGTQYLAQYIDAAGVFCQRYQTSKGLWDHNLGDFGKNCYTNIIVQLCFNRIAAVAHELNDRENEDRLRKVAKHMKQGIYQTFWKKGGFIKSDKCSAFCDMANSIALAYDFVSADEAKEMAESFQSRNFEQVAHGKTLVLTIRGLIHYGFDKIAYKLLTGKTRVEAEKNYFLTVDWMGVTSTETYPHTTIECQHFPPAYSGTPHSWGDLSHPDTSVCELISGCILGIRPLETGFRKILIRPNLHTMNQMKGTLLTKYGKISLEVKKEGEKTVVSYSVPKETEVVLDLSRLGGTLVLDQSRSEAECCLQAV